MANNKPLFAGIASFVFLACVVLSPMSSGTDNAKPGKCPVSADMVFIRPEGDFTAYKITIANTSSAWYCFSIEKGNDIVSGIKGGIIPACNNGLYLLKPAGKGQFYITLPAQQSTNFSITLSRTAGSKTLDFLNCISRFANGAALKDENIPDIYALINESAGLTKKLLSAAALLHDGKIIEGLKILSDTETEKSEDAKILGDIYKKAGIEGNFAKNSKKLLQLNKLVRLIKDSALCPNAIPINFKLSN